MSNIDKNIRRVGLLLIIILIIGLFVGVTLFITYISPVNSESEEEIAFIIENGWSKNKILEELENKDLIKSSFFAKILLKMNDSELYAGTYNLSKDMSTSEILDSIKNQESVENETITVTFVEGKRLTSYVKQISQEFGFTEDEIFDKLNNQEYLSKLIDKYWFLTSNILNENIYYPLEGYLYPDTYVFKKNSSLEEILDKFLSNLEEKLSVYKEDIEISKYSVHEYLTMASIVELEGANSSDRNMVAGVFYNRLNDGWTLGSDVTTYYAVNKDFSVDLTLSDLRSCNGYNTRGDCVEGLPIGPVCNAGLSSISAAIEPVDNDYYYFVADKEKNTYFNKTEREHNSTISKLKSEGKWYEY